MIKRYYLPLIAVLFFALIIFILYPSVFPKEIKVLVPFDGTLYPADMAPPLFSWEDKTGADNWKLGFNTIDNKVILQKNSDSNQWSPESGDWNLLKQSSKETNIRVEIFGYKKILGFNLKRSFSALNISTSTDSVSAPIFFRSVTLPFEFAIKNMDTIKWCVGDVSSGEKPRIVLENMPVCGNCHSFSADGKTIGMDVDYSNDKGSYIITDVKSEMVFQKEDVITWSDYRSEDKELTYGLLSSISPDGRYVVSTVKDRSVFVPKDDLYISQLFFPLKGILAYYDRQTKKFYNLPGADDKRYVQSNSVWSPDGNHIVFARSLADTLTSRYGNRLVLSKEQCMDYLNGDKKFKFDLYKIPFNDGKGGEAVPIEGASGDGMSNYFPKYSPDGKWMVFCKAESFMLLQPDSKLYIMPAEGGTPRLMKCNRDMMNSWHSWSPNGKWLVFSSKAFTPYTQLFLTHIDENGNDTPPVLLSSFNYPERAVNIPEFINNSPECIVKIQQKFMDDYSYMLSGLYSETSFNDFERAEKDFKAALLLNPNNSKAHLSLGRIYFNKKDFVNAEKEFLETVKLDPSEVYSHNKLGEIYTLRDQHDLAEKHFNIILKIAPDNYYALHNLGYLYMKKKLFKEAEDVFTRLVKLIDEKKNSNADAVTSATSKNFIIRAHGSLGNCYSAQSEYVKAIEEFKKIIKIDPDSEIGHITLAKTYLSNGQYDMALKECETALAINPSNESLKKDMQKIKQMLSK